MTVDTKYIFEPNKQVFEFLRNYIKEKASVDTWVGRVKIVKDDKPIVVFEEARNELDTQSTTYDNTTRLLNYNINIYCSKKANSYEISQELAQLVVEVMQGYYHMSGGVIGIIPVFDTPNKPSFQTNLRFTASYIPSKLKIY